MEIQMPTEWRANNGLAPPSDRPFTLSARASDWPVREKAANSGQLSPEFGQARAGEPRWGLLFCPQTHEVR